MLIFDVLLELEGQCTSVEFHAHDFGPLAKSGRKVNPAFAAPSALDLDREAVDRLVIFEVDPGCSDAHIVNGKRSPVGRDVRVESYFVLLRVGVQAEHSAQDWTDDHGCRPDLVRRTGGERLVVVAREDFSE